MFIYYTKPLPMQYSPEFFQFHFNDKTKITESYEGLESLSTVLSALTVFSIIQNKKKKKCIIDYHMNNIREINNYFSKCKLLLEPPSFRKK